MSDLMERAAPSRRERRIVTTDELRELLAQGKKVRLPAVARPSDEVLSHFDDADAARLGVSAEDNPIVSVEYVRDEEVQCISVDDERHLYITDDFMPTHNTSNIVFLKSTDDSMIETLSKISGTRHKVYRDSKTVTKDTESILRFSNVEGKVSYTMSAKEEPVISYNDMAFISERNSIVFRAGDAPVWNRNETILPMSWRLFKDTITHPGHDYALQTIPTLSSAIDFDVRRNQPDFGKMLDKRMRQAEHAVDCATIYREVYEYKDVDIARLDPDVYSDEVMELVDAAMHELFAEEHGIGDVDEIDFDEMDGMYDIGDDWEANMEANQAVAEQQAKQAELDLPRYAGKKVSRGMLVNLDGSAKRYALDAELVEGYKQSRRFLERDTANFSVGADGALRSRDGRDVYITKADEAEALAFLGQASDDAGSRVFAEGDPQADPSDQIGSHEVHPAFHQFLASLDTWQGLADGEFDRMVTRAMQRKEDESLIDA